MKKIILLFVSALLLIGAFSCNTTRDTVLLVQSLKETEWEVRELNGKELNPNNYDSRGLPTVIFIEDGKVSGNTGCNQYQAMYKVNGSEIEFSPGAMTKRYCQGVDEVGFMDALTATTKIENDGDNLLFQNNGTDLMKLTRKAIQ